jgi:PCO_ADO
MLASVASRRHVIRLAMAAAINFSSYVSLLATQGEETVGQLDWDSFVRELTELSKAYSPGQEAEINYVKRVARVLKALDYRERAVQEVTKSSQGTKSNYGITGEQIYSSKDFEISLFELAKDQCFPYHNHPSMTGVTLCLSGRMELHNLDSVGRVDPSTLLLRTSGHAQLSPGRVSWLTSSTGNIHKVRARTDSQMIDVFTPPYSEERVAQSRWYRLERLPANQDLYKARLL